jgi:hypothetical protein
MRTKLRIAFAAIALVVTALAWSAWAAPAPASVEKAVNATHFSFSLVTQSDGSFQARCESGCHWKELHHSCNGKTPCCARVDEKGVHSTPCPPAGG